MFFLLVFSYTTRGKYNDAQKMANLLGSIYPNHPISYLAKALVYGYNIIYRFGNEEPDINKFLELINQAISLEHLNYNKIKFLHLQISILDGLKQYEKLLDTINYAIKLIPSLFYFYNLKIYYLTITRRELEALELTDELIKKFPDLKYKLNERKTSILFKTERYEEALEINNELIKLYPEKIDYINNQAMILGYSGKKEEAIETAKHLIQLNPNISNSYDTFGNVYMVFEEYKKAIDKFEEALRLDPSNILNFHTYLRLGLCYKELKNYEKARECFEKGKMLTERMIPSLKEYYLPETKKQLSELESIMNQSENLKADESS